MSIKATTSKQALLDLINADNDTSFVAEDITISTITRITPTGDDDTRNAKATLTGVDPVKYPGEVEVKWTRRPAKEIFTDSTVYLYNPGMDEAAVQDWLKNTYLANRPIPFDEGSYRTVITALDKDNPESSNGLFQFLVTLIFSEHTVLNDNHGFHLCTDHKTLKELVTKPELDGFTEEATAADTE